jgi:Na+-driven multidrug efflux pump
MTVITNYVFMRVFDWGIEGAAWATALTGIWSMGWRTSLMWRLFRIHPFSRSWVWVAGLAGAAGWLALAMGVPAWASALGKAGHVAWALVQGGVAGGAVLGGAWVLGSFPELTKEFRDRLPRP